ncbi:MAG: phospholipid carrier-dependent glycosyltransferase [Candidatus Omnitrophica bacterium]|nr:phospholipid carrier-dependent glycosyltransferase [Candidatus Omnitrophota bacterium]
MKKNLNYLLFCLAALVLFFLALDKIPLWSSDEGRFGEIAREMWESRNFVVPHFNFIVYLEKPILSPFLTALSYGLMGVNAFSTRFPIVFLALLGIFFCYRFTRRIFDSRTAELSSVVLLTTIGYVLVGRFAVIDMIMTFFLSMTLFCLWTAFLERKKSYYFLAYFLMGLAFLTKGLIGILLPGLVFFVFLMWTGNLRELKHLQLGWGCLILAVVILPWCIAISIKEPEFFKVFIVDQHFTRFATGGFGRRRPFWFFIPILIATGFPWTFFMPAAISDGLKQKDAQRIKIQFLICWIAVIFLFFSIPKSKLPYYLLPVSMPMAILTGHFFANGEALQRSRRLLQRIGKLLAIFTGIAALGFFIFSGWIKDEKFILLKPILMLTVPLIFGGCFAAYYFLNRKGKPLAAFLSLAGMVYGGLILVILGMVKLSPFQSSFEYAEVLKPLLKTGDEVAIFSSPDRFSDFPFYLKKRVIIVGPDRGTLRNQSIELEIDQQREYFLQIDDFVRSFNAKTRRQFCLMEEDRLQELLLKGLREPIIVKKDYGHILISNF